MTRTEIDGALRRIFADLFDRPEEEFTAETSPDTLLDWDSMAHVQLMAAIEERFNMVVEPEDQVEMLSFDLIGDILTEKLAA
ncbi:MAG: acyl carrier protein [Rhodospirillaceae bacterium]|jgi:acyl carrier protein|nr:acyl carrier protein [Rhodospirillaceae bacterium]MBT6117733.1 acyl carrier protein [Rhodospirillaceae bacterium]